MSVSLSANFPATLSSDAAGPVAVLFVSGLAAVNRRCEWRSNFLSALTRTGEVRRVPVEHPHTLGALSNVVVATEPDHGTTTGVAGSV